MDRLFLVGMTVLDISKHHMYRSYYSAIRPLLTNQCSVVLSDTDSFILKVWGHSRNAMLDRLKPIMDHANYPPSHPRYSQVVQSRPGYFKDENASNVMVECVGLRSKCYITRVVTTANGKETQNAVCKGIPRATRKSFTLDFYRDCLRTIQQVRVPTYCIRSQKHVITTQRINKIGLSSMDDKRHSLCAIHTVPYGDHRIVESAVSCFKCDAK